MSSRLDRLTSPKVVVSGLGIGLGAVAAAHYASAPLQAKLIAVGFAVVQVALAVFSLLRALYRWCTAAKLTSVETDSKKTLPNEGASSAVGTVPPAVVPVPTEAAKAEVSPQTNSETSTGPETISSVNPTTITTLETPATVQAALPAPAPSQPPSLPTPPRAKPVEKAGLEIVSSISSATAALPEAPATVQTALPAPAPSQPPSLPTPPRAKPVEKAGLEIVSSISSATAALPEAPATVQTALPMPAPSQSSSLPTPPRQKPVLAASSTPLPNSILGNQQKTPHPESTPPAQGGRDSNPNRIAFPAAFQALLSKGSGSLTPSPVRGSTHFSANWKTANTWSTAVMGAYLPTTSPTNQDQDCFPRPNFRF